jgi:hypothetical protein
MGDLQGAAAVGAVFDVEDPFEQPGPTQARRGALRVIACGGGCLLWRTGDDFTTQLCVRREHAIGRLFLYRTLSCKSTTSLLAARSTFPRWVSTVIGEPTRD